MSPSTAELEPKVEAATPAYDRLTLEIPPSTRLTISPDDFWDLCAANRDMRLERTAEGFLIVMSPAGGGTGRRNALLTIRLGAWAETEGTGLTFDSSTGYTLPNGAVRAPDASWITWDRWNCLTPVQREKFSPICPDFVIELTSPSDTRAKAREKMAEYLAQGARLGWLIDPFKAEVEIHRPGHESETLRHPATLSGEDVLPGFVLDLTGILPNRV